jgi:hypothetical protein
VPGNLLPICKHYQMINYLATNVMRWAAAAIKPMAHEAAPDRIKRSEKAEGGNAATEVLSQEKSAVPGRVTAPCLQRYRQ